jgi:Family of unknown function (DUF5670)
LRSSKVSSGKAFILLKNGNLTDAKGNLQQEGRAAGPIYCPSRRRGQYPLSGAQPMLWTITIILFILWILGLVSSYTMGGWIHILLVLAIIVLIFNLMSGRRAL